MEEIILIQFHEPEETEIITSYPHKLVLHDTYYEFYTRHHIWAKEDDEEIKKEWNVDSKALVFKHSIEGIELYFSNNKKCYAININSNGNGSATILFGSKSEANDVYVAFQKWLLTSK